ncbi:phage tail assembly protein [Tissierella sp. MSJ-40]|uniref:Phage tail assembly protein n=1 Tax=Tissierella simiarum TaxID=2841534 RepID=A0ABS6E5V9_9FIRM|nr:phage tail assembly protein [Tissierella simiarum]MBU5438307.1 phage tail assembly protein [Tissierella simiarum]
MNENIKSMNMEGAELTIKGENTDNQVETSAVNKNATEGENGVYVHKFKKPFEFEGKKFETLNFYFDRLTGKDMISIETEMQEMGEYALAPEISRGFQCRMAAKAGGIGADVLESMPLVEFNKITNAARNFLISSGY